jgi:hypothetical protein
MSHTLEEFLGKANQKGAIFKDPILQSLYLIKQDDWEGAHNIAQDEHNKFGSLVHGYLHRIEGDNWNASYWYRQAGEKDFKGSFDEEWIHIVKLYLDR